jgi:hypothetical protein
MALQAAIVGISGVHRLFDTVEASFLVMAADIKLA